MNMPDLRLRHELVFSGIFLLITAACSKVTTPAATITASVISERADYRVEGDFICTSTSATTGNSLDEVIVTAKGGTVRNVNGKAQTIGQSFVVESQGRTFEQYTDISVGPKIPVFHFFFPVPAGVRSCRITIVDPGRPVREGWKHCDLAAPTPPIPLPTRVGSGATGAPQCFEKI
jgi:hypothetical protein